MEFLNHKPYLSVPVLKLGICWEPLRHDIEHLQDVYNIGTIFPDSEHYYYYLLLLIISITFLMTGFLPYGFLFVLSIIVVVYPLLSLFLLKKRQIKQKEKRSSLYQTLTDAIFGLGDWIISGQQECFIQQFTKISVENNELDKKIRYWNQSRNFQLQTLSGIILIFVGVWAGNMAQVGNIAPAYIAAFTLVTLPILEGLIPVSHAIERIPTYQESLHRLNEIEKYLPTADPKPIKTPPLLNSAEIAIEDVCYRYNKEEKYALQNISLSLPFGKKIAVLGKSGAGKLYIDSALY